MMTFKKTGAIALALMLLLVAADASATHFRYGTLTTRVPNPAQPNRIEIIVELAFRSSYFSANFSQNPQVGVPIDTANFVTLSGQGFTQTSYPLVVIPTVVNGPEDWFVGKAVILVELPATASGTFTALYTSGDRISTLRDRNNDTTWRLAHKFLVDPGGFVRNNGPILSGMPLRTIPVDVQTVFKVPATDPDHDVLEFRLATTNESGMISAQPKTRARLDDPSFTFSSIGEMTWTPSRLNCNPTNTLPPGAPAGTPINEICLYSIQALAMDGRGATTPFEFLFDVVQPAGTKPTLKIDGVTATEVIKNFFVGVQTTVEISAVDSDSLVLGLESSSPPDGALLNPTLPILQPRIGTSASASTLLTWTPSLGQTSQVIEFAANDQDGNEVTSTLIANVGSTDFMYLAGYIREFSQLDAGFARPDGDNTTTFVEDALGPDGKPVFKNSVLSLLTTVPTAAAFNQWWNRPPTEVRTFPLANGGGGDVFSFAASDFRDGDKYFTYEAHTYLTYQPGMMLQFSSSDDLWIFINGKLAVDLGGVHTAPRTTSLNLDVKAAQLGLTAFGTYSMDIFYAHRGFSHVSSIGLQVPEAAICSALGAPQPVTTPMLSGSAQTVGAITRLSTANAAVTSGAAWTANPQQVAAGFNVEFDFKIAPAVANGGEGFAFVVQSVSPTARGNDGSHLGYGGLTRSIAIEFDTHLDVDQNDPIEHYDHVGVRFNSATPTGAISANEIFSLGRSLSSALLDFNNNQVQHVRIQYQAPPVDPSLPPGAARFGWIRLWLGNSIHPAVVAQIDANKIALAFPTGFGYFGFTTGAHLSPNTTATVDITNVKIAPLVVSGALSSLVTAPETILPDTLASVVLQLRDICNVKVGGGGQAASIAATLATTDGYSTPVTIIDQGDGTYKLTYSPRVGGPWNFSVLVGGIPILNSPYQFTVMPATPTLSAAGGTFPYNAAPRSATGTARGVFNEPLGALTFTYNGQPAAVDAGSYDAVGSYAGNLHYAAATAAPVTLTITRIAPTVTVNNTTVTYNGQPQSATGSVMGIGGVVIGSPAFSYTPDPPIDAGSYAVTGGFAGNTNYTEASGSGTLTIGVATPLVTIADVSATYDGAPHPATATVTGVNGETLGAATLTYDGVAAPPIDAGSYVVAASIAASGNYGAGSGSGVVVIAKATPSVEVTSATTTYNAAPQGVAAVVKGINGISIGAPDAVTYDGSAALPVDAGHYDVLASVAETQNYVAATGAGSLTIDPATPSVTVNSASFVYDGAAHGVSGSVAGVGGVLLGPLSFTFDGDPAEPVNAKSYEVVASFTGGGNYTNASGAGTLTITPATPTVIVNNASFVYDGQPHTVTGTVIGIGEDQPGPLTFTYDGDSSAPVNAKTYQVVASFAASGNYGNATGEGTLDITRAGATVNVTGGTFTYDGQAHAASVTITGVDGVDLGAPSSVTYNGSAASPRDAASYAVVASFDATTNYNAGSGSATIVINQVPLTIAADNKTMGERTAVPALTASYAGFVNGETAAVLDSPVVLSTTATSTSAPGTYAIVASGAADVNYNITFTPGVLTIMPITPGLMRGGGFVRDDFNKYDFEFFVRENATGLDRGRLELRVKDEDRNGRRGKKPRNDRFVSKLLTNVVFSDDPTSQPGKSPKVQMDTVLFAGSGEWNGQAGYRFEAFAQDLGEPGRHRESIRITVFDAAGNIVAHAEGDLGGGNIQSARIKH